MTERPNTGWVTPVIGTLAVIGIAVFVMVGEPDAQPAGPPDTPTPAGELTFTAEEQKLLAEVDARKFIAARAHAEAMLRGDPDSFVATWAMALVHHEEEGNHARALYFARRAEKLLRKRGLDPVWHKRVLIEEIDILGEMDDRAEELKRIDAYGALYTPKRDDLKIWPLIKLKRYDEARAIAESLVGSDQYWERISAHNGLMTIEEEQRLRAAMYERTNAAVAAFGDQSCIILRNAGIGSWEAFKPRESEERLTRALDAPDDDCSSTPYIDLAWLYYLAGDFTKAVAAIKSAAGKPIEKRYRAHHSMERRAMLADLLHALGKPIEAERLAAEVHAQPERAGMTSNSAAMLRLVRTLRYWLALDARLILERERGSYRSFYAGLVTRTRLRLARWEIRRALFQLAADADALITITRPNLSDTHVPRWTNGGLVEILGPGVMKTAVAIARRRDADFPEAAAYFDALDGEIAFRDDEPARAVELAGRALDALPPEEGLLRWYTLAWKSAAEWQLGRRDAAIAGYHQVLQKLPGALRILDLSLPVTIQHDGTALARDAASRLHDSTRFTSGSDDFRATASSTAGKVTLCLVDKTGFQFACATGEANAQDDAVGVALDAFHAAAFSPKVAVTELDLNSLDGSPTSRSADELLEGMLK